ncbi:hypothetical protein ACHWQZ_G007017 [Mnemiopsis leidyi]
MILSIPEILSKKRNGEELLEEELEYFIDCVCNDKIDKSQIGAMLMAFCLRGLTTKETVTLTKSMRNSGTVQQWDPSWKMVDKHSTGGVGDKVTFPLVAAVPLFGLKMPMISGRGLGHTGGTADKLESIPGFQIGVPEDRMRKTLDEIGCYITVTFGNIAPADRTLYAIRDITSTVCYAPLICASIMSKKLAEGIDSLVLDVKIGGASTTESYEEAEWLARKMVEIGEGMGVDATAVLTEMDTPLGYAIGNSLEMIESLECIRGNGPDDLEKIVAVQGGILLCGAGIASSQQEGEEMIVKTFKDGTALEKFLQILGNQGVEKQILELLRKGEYDKVFAKANHVENVSAKLSGYIEAVDAMAIGKSVVLLGGGRQLPEDPIDPAVGIKLLMTKGDKVQKGDILAEIHHNGKLSETLRKRIEDAFLIGDQEKPLKRVISVVRHNVATEEYDVYRNLR